MTAMEKGGGLNDYDFALNIRRLLLSIATLIEKKYNNRVLLIILKGKK